MAAQRAKALRDGGARQRLTAADRADGALAAMGRLAAVAVERPAARLGATKAGFALARMTARRLGHIAALFAEPGFPEDGPRAAARSPAPPFLGTPSSGTPFSGTPSSGMPSRRAGGPVPHATVTWTGRPKPSYGP
ncbi:hypothetical protein [Streptomyces sp. NPDC015125]|uniref:hypothetical protein n=1 Tax=Streptomyces sp. NPDC015125 TaxID=3364938 RepID=UPI0036F53F98